VLFQDLVVTFFDQVLPKIHFEGLLGVGLLATLVEDGVFIDNALLLLV
jgi:hypothetical protein